MRNFCVVENLHSFVLFFAKVETVNQAAPSFRSHRVEKEVNYGSTLSLSRLIKSNGKPTLRMHDLCASKIDLYFFFAKLHYLNQLIPPPFDFASLHFLQQRMLCFSLFSFSNVCFYSSRATPSSSFSDKKLQNGAAKAAHLMSITWPTCIVNYFRG